MGNSQTQLFDTLHVWAEVSEDFADQSINAARTATEWERFKANTRIRLKAEAEREGLRVTAADLDAEIIAADLGNLQRDAAVSAAVVSGLRKRMDMLSATVDSLRSRIASERAHVQGLAAASSGGSTNSHRWSYPAR